MLLLTRSAGIMIILVAFCFVMTTAAAALAVRRPDLRLLKTEAGSKLHADYSADKSPPILKRLDTAIIEDAEDDDRALTTTRTPERIGVARVPTATSTPELARTPPSTPAQMSTPRPAMTSTAVASATAVPPTIVPTVVPSTPVPPTATLPTTAPPTAEPPTLTPNTPLPTATTPADTPTPQRSPTLTPTSTKTVTPSPTRTTAPTDTPQPTSTPTLPPVSTLVATLTPTLTPLSTNTPAPTPTPTPTNTAVPTPTDTSTHTPTPTPTVTPTPTYSFTPSPTSTVSPTPTATVTSTATPTPTPLSTTFGAAADTYVEEDHPVDLNGGKNEMEVDGDLAKNNRSFVRFDVSSIPSNATLTSAVLTLCYAGKPSGGSEGHTHELRMALGTWSELLTDWITQPAASSSITASIVVPGDETCMTMDVTSDVQAWVDGTANLGWRLSDQDELSDHSADAKYGTRENGDPAKRPRLAVSYVP